MGELDSVLMNTLSSKGKIGLRRQTYLEFKYLTAHITVKSKFSTKLRPLGRVTRGY